jgi:transcriptional antiterminator RfaH
MTQHPAGEWYVVQTRPGAERKACAHLQRQGFATYLPQYSKQRRHGSRVDTLISPLFPRYVFVNVDMETQRWRCIQSTIGVSRLVCNGDQPAPIQPRLLDDIRAREDERGLVTIEPTPPFAHGDKVRVLSGIFSASQGLFDSVTDDQRVAILLDLLGRKVRVCLEMDLVEAV